MSNIALSERRKWMGASESACLFGVGFQTYYELFMTKLGRLQRQDLDGDERVMAGQFLEPAIAAWAERKWSWGITKAKGYDTHPSIAQMGASVDFETVDRCPVEIKNVDGLIFRDEWKAEGDTIVDAPLKYLIQIQHQLACRPDVPGAWLLACVGGNRLVRGYWPKHESLIEAIEDGVADFWDDMRAGKAPDPNYATDASAVIAMAYATGGGEIDLSHHNHAAVLCREYQRGAEMVREGRQIQQSAKAELLDIIGNADRAIIAGGFTISTSTISESEVEYVRKGYRGFRVTQRGN